MTGQQLQAPYWSAYRLAALIGVPRQQAELDAQKMAGERGDNLSEKIREFIRAYGKGEK